MRITIAAIALILAGCGGGAGTTKTPEPTVEPVAVSQPAPVPAPAPVAPPPAPEPPPATPSGPVVIYVGNSAADTMRANGCCSDVIEPYMKAGFIIEPIDAPCHGTDAPLCITEGLDGWAAEVAAGNREWLDRFCARLIEAIADRPVFLAGTSRGAYAILSCDIGSPVRGIIANAPLIDLHRLSEFKRVPRNPGFELMAQRVPTMIRIGRNDERVGTQPAIDYAMQTGAELRVLDVEGHIAPEDGTGIEFIRSHIG